MKGIKAIAFLSAVVLLIILSFMVIRSNNQKQVILNIYLDRYNLIQKEVASLSLNLNNEINSLEQINEKQLKELISLIKNTEKNLLQFSADIPVSVDLETKEMWKLINNELTQLPYLIERSILEKNSLDLKGLKELTNSLEELSDCLKLEGASIEDINRVLAKRSVINQYIEVLEKNLD